MARSCFFYIRAYARSAAQKLSGDYVLVLRLKLAVQVDDRQCKLEALSTDYAIHIWECWITQNSKLKLQN